VDLSLRAEPKNPVGPKSAPLPVPIYFELGLSDHSPNMMAGNSAKEVRTPELFGKSKQIPLENV
jgi:hypothetical protein